MSERANGMGSGVVWVCGQMPDEPGEHWAVMGVFTEERLAVAACVDGRCFVGPVQLNVELGDVERVDWPGVYYPKAGPEVGP